MRELLIKFLDSIRDYERESHNLVGHDERDSAEFVDIYLKENANLTYAELEEVLTFEQAIVFLNKLLEKPNGAAPYKSYIENHLAKDFAVDIVKAISGNRAVKI